MLCRAFLIVFIFAFAGIKLVFADNNAMQEAKVFCNKGFEPITKRVNGTITVLCKKTSVKKKANVKKPVISSVAKNQATAGTFYRSQEKKGYLFDKQQKPDQTIVRHYYVPLQKKEQDISTKINEEAFHKEKRVEEESSYDWSKWFGEDKELVNSFDGPYFGLGYQATLLGASNTAISNSYGANPQTYRTVENQNITQHGVLGFLGYNFLFFNKKLVFSTEIRMGYNIPKSNYFNSTNTIFDTSVYSYHNFASNMFVLPSLHVRLGILILSRFLPYITAGLGVYQLNYNTADQITYVGNAQHIPFAINTPNKISVNFPIGAGIEFALHKHVHLRFEYLYSIYMNTSETYYANNGPGVQPSQLTYNYSLSSHSFIFALVFCI